MYENREYLVIKNYRNGETDYLRNVEGLFADKYFFPTIEKAKEAIDTFLGDSEIKHRKILTRSNPDDIVFFEIRYRETSPWIKIQ